ncbi:MAG: TIGR03905 family TSCPD domain-containing protein, partial [Eubacteriales bacterium]
MTYTYRTKGTCSSLITFDINDGVVSNVSFTGGCNGNLKAISKLVDGMDAEKL